EAFGLIDAEQGSRAADEPRRRRGVRQRRANRVEASRGVLVDTHAGTSVFERRQLRCLFVVGHRGMVPGVRGRRQPADPAPGDGRSTLERMVLHTHKLRMPRPEEALPGRDTPLEVPELHAVSGRRIQPPFPARTALAMFGMGCFWGAERKFWSIPGVDATMVGYAGRVTPKDRK